MTESRRAISIDPNALKIKRITAWLFENNYL